MPAITEAAPGPAARATKAALAQIERWNPQTNALLTVLPNDALETANALDALADSGGWGGVLHGMVISVKDNIDVLGVPTTAASNILRHNRPTQDAVVVERLKRNGAVIIGKANLHEFAFGPTSQSLQFGPCVNPWCFDRVAGGSSGGSGVSVVTGMSIASIGSDTAGSIRIPASYNGVAGLRPTIGRIPCQGSIPLSPAFDTLGPLARRVADVARIFSAISGFNHDDPLSVRQPVPNVASGFHDHVSGLRLGVARRFFFDNIDTELAQCLETAIATYHDLGAEIVDIDLGDLTEVNKNMASRIQLADAYAVHWERLKHRRSEYGSDLLTRFDQGAKVSGRDYAEAMRCLEGWRHRVASVFDNVHAILTPTTPTPAPQAIEVNDLNSVARQNITRCTTAWAFAGVPSLVLPCGFSMNGLPLSMQLTSSWFDESTLFVLGHAFQTETDHHMRLPAGP